MPRTKNHIDVVHNDKAFVPKRFAKSGKGHHLAHDLLAERNALLAAWEKFLAKNEGEALDVPFPPFASLRNAPDRPGYPDEGRIAYLAFMGCVFADTALAERHPENERFAARRSKRLPQLLTWNQRFTLGAVAAMSAALDAVSAEQRAIEFLRTHRTIQVPTKGAPSLAELAALHGHKLAAKLHAANFRTVKIETATIPQLVAAMATAGLRASPGTVKAARQEVARMDVGQHSSTSRQD